MLLLGDCLKKIKKIIPSSVDLIYLDPPFFTQTKQILKDKNLKEYSFDDTWKDIDEYKAFIKVRVKACRKVLKDTGSIFLHCDKIASHHLRVILDEVFGVGNFQSEIIWSYKRWSNAKKGLLNSHQVIFFYSKTGNFTFNTLFTDYSETTNVDQIFQKRKRDKNGKIVYQKNDSGECELIEQKNGVPLSDVWEIPYLNPKAKERVGYPTQKPILLLEQIIKIASNKGDTVLDPFCGSGTTLVAAKLLGRNYIGIDISPDAVELTEKRLEKPIKTESMLLKKGKSAYTNQNNSILDLLRKIDAEPVQRNKGIDGFLRIDGKMKPIPIRIQRNSETVEYAQKQLSNAIVKNGFRLAILYKTTDKTESTLFTLPNVSRNDNFYIFDRIDDLLSFKRKFAAMR
ncbi:MAG: DNA adenine methylase [Endomicrobium sp.]|jgi:site-specific DNA-methyltransferase (adenine-specific)|nr:DNA adenine methylase [Endomicrobium sp.]